MVEKGSVGRVGLWIHIAQGIAAMTLSLTMVAMVYCLRIMFGSTVFAVTALLKPDEQLKNFGGTTARKMARLSRPGQAWGRGTVGRVALSTCS